METDDIYIIKNKINDKIYIGQTKSYRKKGIRQIKFGYMKRFKEHITSAIGNPTYGIDREMAKLGVNHFYVELIGTYEITQLDQMEAYYIKQYNSLVPNGYNVVLGNPAKNSNPEHISKQLIKYYDNSDIKKKHSDIHKNKFAKIEKNNLKEIEIKPIKQDGINKIIYVYFKYNDDKIIRRRYGGIHIDFENNYNRCLEDLNTFQNINVIDCVKDPNVHKKITTTNVKEIIDILLTIFKVKDKNTIALYLNYNKGRTRIVFGGKTITYENAFSNALKYIKINNLQHKQINISESLKATLPNCGELLKNIDTTS